MNKCFAIIIVLISFSVVFAQNEGTRVYLNLGMSMQTSPNDFRENWPEGYGLGVGIGFSINESLSAIPYFEYFNSSINKDNYLNLNGFNGKGITIEGGLLSTFSISCNLKQRINLSNSSFVPYLTGGIGYYILTTRNININDNLQTTQRILYESDSAFSLNFGTGLDINLNSTTILFVDLRYLLGFTKNKNTGSIPIRAGISFVL